MKIGIIGLGRMGFVQARLGRFFGDDILWGCDCSIEACEEFSREFNVPVFDSAEKIIASQCELVWLTVNDDHIGNCAKIISSNLPISTTVFHTSGVLESKILKPSLPEQACASYHPLMACPLKSCSDNECACAYQGIIHSVEGDVPAVNIAKKLIERLNGKFVQIKSSDKVLYHAAAVFSSNYPLILMDIAVQLFKECGFDKDNALSACKLMTAQILKSLENNSIPDALTGPIKRKDSTTIKRHQDALQSYPEYLQIYNLLKDAAEKMLSRG